MKTNIFRATLVACTMLAVSCAEEITNVIPLNNDEPLMENNLQFERLLNNEATQSAVLVKANTNFNQVAQTIGRNAYGEVEFSGKDNPETNVDINLELETIMVEEFMIPQQTATNPSKTNITTDTDAMTTNGSFSITDNFSDGQIAYVDSSWVYSYFTTKYENLDYAHIEVENIFFNCADVEYVDELTSKVILNYVVEYKTIGITDGDYKDTVTVSPFYYQKKEKVIVDEIGEPYYVCEPIYTYETNSIKGKFIVKKITPHTLVEDEVEVIAQRTLTVATIGKPGDETLRVFSNQMSSNVHTSSNTTETTGEKNNFSWVARSTEHVFIAEWNSNGLEVGHTDKIMVYGMTVKYQDENCEFNFEFNTELNVVTNEVIVEKDVTTEEYLGTRVLTIEGLLNGEKFAEFTGKTTLLQHS